MEVELKKSRSTVAAADSPLMVNSVQKAFRVLTAFSPNEPRLTLTQIADNLDIDKSTAQRFTHTLVVMGYLDKDAGTKTFGVTVKVLDLAHIYLASNPLISTVMPYLLHLNRETGETVNLAVLDGGDVVFVSRIVGNFLLSTGVVIGSRFPAYVSAAGLAMMSAMTDPQVKQLLKQTDLRAYTPRTIYAPAKVLERVQQARARGYSVSSGNYFPKDISIGAPIVSRSGALLGAISLAVSDDRFSVDEAESKFSKVVIAAAKSVPL